MAEPPSTLPGPSVPATAPAASSHPAAHAQINGQCAGAAGGSSGSGSGGDAAAGPSRHRAASADTYERAHAGGAGAAGSSGGLSNTTPRGPASPRDAPGSRHASPAREPTPHFDLASYPTPLLLRMLASLLQQIASANDLLRAEQDEEAAGSAGGASTSSGTATGAGAGAGASASSTHEAMQQDTPPPDCASNTGSTRSSLAHPSPTTELFHDQPPQADLAAGDRLFTASKISLAHPSSILSFHARHVPSISIEAYLLRILKYCPTTNEVFLGLLVYFDRMSKLGTPAGVGGTSAAVGPRGFAIDSYNVHRLIIAGVTVASKFFSDVFYTNSRYAKVGGLPPGELNQLELQFLLLNNFTLMIPPEEMQKYGDRLIAYWQSREQEAAADAEPETRPQPQWEQQRQQAERPPLAQSQRPASATASNTSTTPTASQSADRRTPLAHQHPHPTAATAPSTPTGPTHTASNTGGTGGTGLSRAGIQEMVAWRKWQRQPWGGHGPGPGLMEAGPGGGAAPLAAVSADPQHGNGGAC